MKLSRRFVIKNIQGAWDKRVGGMGVEGEARERCQQYLKGLLSKTKEQEYPIQRLDASTFKRNNQNQPVEKLDLHFRH